MSGYFAPLSRFPFTAAISGSFTVDDTGSSVDLTLPDGVDPAKANTLLLQNTGSNTVWYLCGDTGVVAVASAGGSMDTTSCAIAGGAVFTYPCPPTATAAIGIICASGETSSIIISRGWGQ